jgi:hypothetical protein
MTEQQAPETNVVQDGVIVRAEETTVAEAQARQVKTNDDIERGLAAAGRDAAGSLVAQQEE